MYPERTIRKGTIEGAPPGWPTKRLFGIEAVCSMVNYIIRDEEGAVELYDMLAKELEASGRNKLARKLREAKKDEEKHLYWFQDIKMNWCKI